MKIVLIGDTLLNKNGIRLDSKVKKECSNADLVIMNLEGPITTLPPQKLLGSAIASHPDNISVLDELNVSVAILGNNHIMDHGEEGLNDTIERLAKKGIKYVGAGSFHSHTKSPLPDIIELNNVVIFSYTHNEGPMSSESNCGPVSLPNIDVIINQIKEYKEKHFKVIFNYHGGEEFFTVPWPRRRGFLKRVSRAGADIIFGHHSHSIQPIEIESGRVIIYSPGNFYMDTLYQRNHVGTEKGFITAIEGKEVILHHVKVDRQDKKLVSTKVKNLNMSVDVLLSEYEAVHKWVCECKQNFNKPIQRKFFLSKNKLVVRLIRYISFLRTISRLKNKKRDIDIFLSSLPILGIIYAKRLYEKGYNKFDF